MSDNSGIPAPFKLERFFSKHEFAVKYSLCCSDPESYTMKEILEMADEECKDLWENLSLSYTNTDGHPLLKQEIAKMHENVTEEHVLTVIPQEGIYIAMHCLVSHLKKIHSLERIHAVATFPAYQSLYENLKTLGCDLGYWTAKYQGQKDGWTFDMDNLKSLIREDTKLLVVNFPHNPTGFTPSLKMWQDIIALCQEKNIYLFADEMYRLTNNDGSKPNPAACSLYDNAVSLSGLSKTFALPGVRMGWLVTRNQELMKLFENFKDYLSICLPAPSEILGIIALRNKEKIVENTIAVAKHNLDALDKFFKDFPTLFEWPRPNACTIGFLCMKKQLLDQYSASEFCHALLKETDVLLLPAEMFDFEDSYMRLGFGRKNLPEALEAMRPFLQKIK